MDPVIISWIENTENLRHDLVTTCSKTGSSEIEYSLEAQSGSSVPAWLSIGVEITPTVKLYLQGDSPDVLVQQTYQIYFVSKYAQYSDAKPITLTLKA